MIGARELAISSLLISFIKPNIHRSSMYKNFPKIFFEHKNAKTAVDVCSVVQPFLFHIGQKMAGNE